MVKVTVLYAEPDDPAAFEKYYAETHIPLALKIPNLVTIEANKAIPAVGPPPYYRVGELTFDSVAKFQEALASPEAQAAIADLENFAPGDKATMLVLDVKPIKVPAAARG